jgi:hypothetical protein
MFANVNSEQELDTNRVLIFLHNDKCRNASEIV